MTDRNALRADCARCTGLCCVVPAFAASADFAIAKPAGQPCVNLLADHRCGIHDRLRERGFPGCVVFDCFGAGQHLTQHTFAGHDWRTSPRRAQMFAAFTVLRQLNELRWYLAEARALIADGPLRTEIDRAAAETEHLTTIPGEELAAFDAPAHRQRIGPLLGQVSATVRGPHAPDRRNADLIGAKLRGRDLRRTGFRGAYLLGADLRDADLRQADLLGADLRAANLAGADLRDALFLTQPQLDAATGDATTRIPAALTRPTHWESPA